MSLISKLTYTMMIPLLLTTLACGDEEKTENAETKVNDASSEKKEAPKPQKKEAKKDSPKPEEKAPPKVVKGKIHLDYPIVETTAKAGQFVFAPSRQFLDEALAGKRASFIFYGATVIETGKEESTVESLAGTKFSIPNSLIIPIQPTTTATKGDFLLADWSASLQQSIVVGGSSEEPIVRHLSLDYDNPSKIGTKEFTLKKERFHKLEKAGQVGTTAACGPEKTHGMITHSTEEKLLLLGWAGKLLVFNKKDCKNIALGTTFSEGMDVYHPSFGSYSDEAGKVIKVDAAIGRVWVSHEFAGKKKETAFSVLDLSATPL